MTRKHFIPILLAVLMLLTALPPAALAAEPGSSEGQAGLALLQSLLPEEGLEEIEITSQMEAIEKYAAQPATGPSACTSAERIWKKGGALPPRTSCR